MVNAENNYIFYLKEKYMTIMWRIHNKTLVISWQEYEGHSNSHKSSRPLKKKNQKKKTIILTIIISFKFRLLNAFF